MGGNYGGRGGRGGSTSRHEGIENSKEKKENQPSGMKISAEEIRKVVGKFLKDLLSQMISSKENLEIAIS